MGHLLGAKKNNFLIRNIDDATMAGASVESCRFVVLRSPRRRLGSVKYTFIAYAAYAGAPIGAYI